MPSWRPACASRYPVGAQVSPLTCSGRSSGWCSSQRAGPGGTRGPAAHAWTAELTPGFAADLGQSHTKVTESNLCRKGHWVLVLGVSIKVCDSGSFFSGVLRIPSVPRKIEISQGRSWQRLLSFRRAFPTRPAVWPVPQPQTVFFKDFLSLNAHQHLPVLKKQA